MGFFKFLNKKKRDEPLDELDLPPAPPPLRGFEENAPELTPFDEGKVPEATEMPSFEFPEERMPDDLGKETLLDFPDFPEIEEKSIPISPLSAPSLPELAPSIYQPTPEIQQTIQEPRTMPSEIQPKIERRLFRHEKEILKPTTIGKTIYVRVDSFKAMVNDITTIRRDLRSSEENLIKLENIKNAKDESFDKAKSSINDMQKKLIFIDKTLFKGE